MSEKRNIYIESFVGNGKVVNGNIIITIPFGDRYTAEEALTKWKDYFEVVNNVK